MYIKLNWSVNSLAINEFSLRQEFRGILGLSNINVICKMSDFKTQEVAEMFKIFHLKLLTMMPSMNRLNTSRSIVSFYPLSSCLWYSQADPSVL